MLSKITDSLIDTPSIHPRSYCLLQLIAAFFTLVFGFVMIVQQPLINTDGTFYLRLADIYLQQGIEGMYALYHWPFYPLLIAWIHKLTGLSLFDTAIILNLTFQVGITLLFVHLVKLLGGNFKTLCFAALAVLILPHLNEYRTYFIRDFGYCFFLLSSTYFILRYCVTNAWHHAFFFILSILLACFFRFEGFAFLFLIPFLVFFKQNLIFYHKFRAFLKIMICAVVMSTVFIIVAYLIYPPIIKKILGVFNTHEVSAMQVFQLKTQIMATIVILKNQLLTENSTKSLYIFIVSGLIGAYVYKTIYVLSPLYTIIAGYSAKRRLMPASQNQKRIVYGYILLNLAITIVYFCIYFFISGRYLLPLVLFVMLWVPFGLAQLYEEWQYMRILGKRKHRWIFPLIMVVLAYMMFSGLISFGESKYYIKDSGNWLKKNTLETNKIYTNEQQILYYAKGTILEWEGYVDTELTKLEDNQWRQYHYLAIKLDRKNPKRLETINNMLGIKPLKMFTNNRGSEVIVYEVPPMMVVVPQYMAPAMPTQPSGLYAKGIASALICKPSPRVNASL